MATREPTGDPTSFCTRTDACAMSHVAVHDVHYVEMVSPDPERTRDFLQQAYGWRFVAAGDDLGGAYVAVLPNGTRCAVRAPLRDDEMPLTRTYVRVENVEKAAKRAEELGAKVALPPVPLGDHGKIAIYFVGGVEHGVWEMP